MACGLRPGFGRLAAEARDTRQEQATAQSEPSDAGGERPQDEADSLRPLPLAQDLGPESVLAPERGLQLVVIVAPRAPSARAASS